MTSSGWTRQHRCEYRQTTVQEPWGATVWLADGTSVRDIALTTRLTDGAIYWHLKQIYQKLPISRQVDLVRLVLSIAEFG